MSFRNLLQKYFPVIFKNEIPPSPPLKEGNKKHREKEEWLYKDGGEEKLDRALEWCANNPPQASDLEELENQLK